MNTKIVGNVVVVDSQTLIIKNVASAVDFVMSVKAEASHSKIALNKSAILEDFFILSTGLAGEILQNFVNYQIKFAIYGDFSHYISQPLRDFIYESNRGKDVFFTDTAEEAIELLNTKYRMWLLCLFNLPKHCCVRLKSQFQTVLFL